MTHTSPTYVIFDGDEDNWAYRFMRGWKAKDHIDFDFRDAHDMDTMTSRAESEDYVKGKLRERMGQSKQVLILVGEKTKNLYKFVRWELELAIDLGLPVIAVNLNGSRKQDINVPPIIRDKCVVHVPFKMKAIKYALDNWPPEYKSMSQSDKAGGYRFYTNDFYAKYGIDD